ncbi:hypothetical protein GGR54DRAFT_483662 [Hypoxylon sp. NC1633]|nr:hypothetical protein GGR54DRAFT_483662 [Hypoxylon sp. NC1633]
MEASDSCDMIGNADFYGIGIRLGLYAQSLTTLLVTLFVQEEEGLNRTLNLLLQLAIFAGTLLLTQKNDIHAFEVVLVFWLLVGALSSLTGDGISAVDSFSGVCRVLFYIALSSYGCWFWFIGLDTMQETSCTQIAFFGGSTLDGWFQTFGKVVAVLGFVVAGGMLAWAGYLSIGNRGGRGRSGRYRRPQTEITLMVLSIVMVILSIVSAEYVIRANHLTGVDDIFAVGQLLAFLVGLFQLLNALVPIFIKGRLWAPRCWLLFGRHLT